MNSWTGATWWLVFFLYIAILLAGIKLAADDARRRGKPPLLVCVLTVFFFPVGTIAWLLFRPSAKAPSAEGDRFDLNDFRKQ